MTESTQPLNSERETMGIKSAIMSNHNYVSGGCYLVSEGGQHILYTPSGEMFGPQTKSTTVDEINSVAVCRVTTLVNICTKDEMLEDIERRKMELANTLKTA